MTTLFYSHSLFEDHDPGVGHPESPERLRAVLTKLQEPEFSALSRKTPGRASEDRLRLVHPQQHIDHVLDSIPNVGRNFVDGDTILSPASGDAAFIAVGAVCEAVDAVLKNEAENAFCAVRPPGHHAEPAQAMGFCLFNNIAIAAEYARREYELQRVAIVDFDVHHGNGTQATFYNDPTVLYASTHQFPLYPGTGRSDERGVGNIYNAPLASGSGTMEFQEAMESIVFPGLHQFKPELLLISAGFDAHRDDPLASLNLLEADYAWVTRELSNIAEKHCNGRIISVLEGGYNLNALANSVAAHVLELLGNR